MHSFKGEGRRVGYAVKDIKGKKIIYKGIKNNEKNRIRWKSKVSKKWRKRQWKIQADLMTDKKAHMHKNNGNLSIRNQVVNLFNLNLFL